jgi:hypothetical protein
LQTPALSVRLKFTGGCHWHGGDGTFGFPPLSLIMNRVEGGVVPDVIVVSHSP